MEKELLQIEEGFWLRGEQHFLDHVDEKCILAFPQMGQMHGIYSREEIARTATDTNRWKDLRIDRHNVLQPLKDMAILTYLVEVNKVDGQPYAALITSGYVHRGNSWKLCFHQHSPV